MEKTENNIAREGTFTSIKNSLGSPSVIYNPESQLLNEMIKDSNTFQSKRSSLSMNSFLDDSQDHDNNKISYTNPFSNNIAEELSAELSRRFILDSEDESATEENSKDVNELLLFKRKLNPKAPESTISENDALSSIYTDNEYGTETQTETQSEYSVNSSKDFKLENEPLKDRIWYYRKPPTSNEDYGHVANNKVNHDPSDSDDSSTMDDSTAAIMQLKLHHYVSTNNLKVKKDNNSIVKRRTTISYSRFKPNLNTNFDFNHDINDIPLFSNNEFKTEAKENYQITDTTFEDYNTSLLLNMTGDASRKRRSQLNHRSRTFSQAMVNEHSSTFSPPLSSNSFKKITSNNNNSNNSFSNISNSNKKQPQLNNPMGLNSVRPGHGGSSGKSENNIQNNIETATVDNSNQLFKVLLMAKDHILSLGGKIKRTNSIRSTASKRSSIRKYQKNPKRHNTRRRSRYSLKGHRKSSKQQNYHSNLHDQSEDEMTTISSTTDADKSINSITSPLRKKSSNSGYLKPYIGKKSSGILSRNSSLLSASTKRSSLYGKSKFYQNDHSINYSASNLSESSAGIDLDEAKKYDESFDLDVQNNSKNDKPGVYGVYPDSYYSEYHGPTASSVDGRSSIYDYDEEEEESVVSESDNILSSYTTGGETYNDIFDIHNRLNVKPLEPLKNESAMVSNDKTTKTTLNNNNNSITNDKTESDTETKREDINRKVLKKNLSSSTIETNLSSDSLTPTITNSNVNHLNDNETKSEYTADRTTITGSVYGDNKSNAPNQGIQRIGNTNNYEAFSNFVGIKRNWDEETASTLSRFNENESRHPIEIASMPEGIRDSNNYPTIKQIPLPYYRYGVYMYITDPVIVQTRTMMERMFSAHTLYTITVKLLRPNLPMYRNDNICTFTVHKRYRQFRSFYKEIHKKYKDTINDWPEFPKKTFFDRFDSDTIKNRAFAFSSLMSFVSLHPLLYNCPVLLTFLEITGSMNNPLSNINSNISKRKGTFENTNQPIEGKTIQFEGRNVAPSIPKIFGSLGRRQYPPGFYGQPPQGQSYYEQSLSYNNNNVNNMQLQRRSMYGKIENNYYNPDYYSSFGRPQLSKMRTTELLRNRNSLYSNLSATEIERINRNDHDTSTIATIKPSAKEVSSTTPKVKATDSKNSKDLSESTSSTTTTATLCKSTANPSISSNESIKKEKNQSPSQLEQSQQQYSNDQKLHISSTSSPSSSNAPTPKLSCHNTSRIESQDSLNNLLSTPTSSSINLKNDINNPNSSSSTTTELEKIPNNINSNIPNKTMDSKNTNNTNNTNSNLIDITSKSSSPTSSSSNTSNSTAKGKDVSQSNDNSENKDTIQSIIPRPRPRPRPRNPVVYRNMDEMDLNYMPVSRYSHYQQIKEIPGFQYLISEFPKLRTTQNKRYSSIF
jgi:hypothetical protein